MTAPNVLAATPNTGIVATVLAHLNTPSSSGSDFARTLDSMQLDRLVRAHRSGPEHSIGARKDADRGALRHLNERQGLAQRSFDERPGLERADARRAEAAAHNATGKHARSTTGEESATQTSAETPAQASTTEDAATADAAGATGAQALAAAMAAVQTAAATETTMDTAAQQAQVAGESTAQLAAQVADLTQDTAETSAEETAVTAQMKNEEVTQTAAQKSAPMPTPGATNSAAGSNLPPALAAQEADNNGADPAAATASNPAGHTTAASVAATAAGTASPRAANTAEAVSASVGARLSVDGQVAPTVRTDTAPVLSTSSTEQVKAPTAPASELPDTAVMEQITKHLISNKLLRDGSHRTVLQLNPQHLGQVTVAMDIHQGSMRMELIASSVALDALNQAVNALRTELSNNGMSLTDVALRQDPSTTQQFGAGGSQNSEAGSQGGASSGTPAQPSWSAGTTAEGTFPIQDTNPTVNADGSLDVHV